MAEFSYNSHYRYQTITENGTLKKKRDTLKEFNLNKTVYERVDLIENSNKLSILQRIIDNDLEDEEFFNEVDQEIVSKYRDFNDNQLEIEYVRLLELVMGRELPFLSKNNI